MNFILDLFSVVQAFNIHALVQYAQQRSFSVNKPVASKVPLTSNRPTDKSDPNYMSVKEYIEAKKKDFNPDEYLPRPQNWFTGGIMEAAKRVVENEKVAKLMAKSIADDLEVQEALTKILRGENIVVGDEEKTVTTKDILSAAKMLQDRFLAERRLSLSGRPTSIMLYNANRAENIGAGSGGNQQALPAPRELAENELLRLGAEIRGVNNVNGTGGTAFDDDDITSLLDAEPRPAVPFG